MSTTPTKPTLNRKKAWAIIDREWREGSHHCLGCDHYAEERDHVPYQEGVAPITTLVCRLLDNGRSDEYLKCHALLGVLEDEADEAEEAEQAEEPPLRERLYVATMPKGQPVPLVIGGAYIPRNTGEWMPADHIAAQDALLDRRTELNRPWPSFFAQLITVFFKARRPSTTHAPKPRDPAGIGESTPRGHRGSPSTSNSA